MRLKIISGETMENLRKRKSILIIDLRDREKYDRGHVPGAVWEDWETLEKNIGKIWQKYYLEKEWIVLYCDRGNISLLLARDLARGGYPVISVNGGFEAWKRKYGKGLSGRKDDAG